MKFVPQTVEYLYGYGNDLAVVNAARVSFDKQQSEFDPGKDSRLINYLAKNNHWTPFGHAGATFRIKAPIFVARQLVKHQVGLVWNETSRRYVDSEPEFYQPTAWRARAESAKQGSGEALDPNQPEIQLDVTLQYSTQNSLNVYQDLLANGVAPEMARMVLPQNMMTEWIWTGSLAAWARVYNLRYDSHTQQETRDVAILLDNEMAPRFPVSWRALTQRN